MVRSKLSAVLWDIYQILAKRLIAFLRRAIYNHNMPSKIDMLFGSLETIIG